MYYVWNSGDISIRGRDGDLCIHDTQGNIKFSLDSTWEDFVDSATVGWKGIKGYWFGSKSGDLDLLDPQTNRVFRMSSLRQKQPMYLLIEDKFGLLWIATNSGNLFCYDHGKDSLIEFVSGTKNLSGIRAGQINQIYEDRKGRLWFATVAGLSRLERSTNSLPAPKESIRTGQAGFVHFTERNGLASNNVRGMLEDDHGLLWLNTSKGISRFDPETHQSRNYDRSYGVEPVADVFYGWGCRTGNGEMYFPGAKGFTRFHPDSIRDNPFVPPIVITSFKKFDTPYPFSREIRLPYDENFISFEFAALSYISPERNQYAYKLEGLDKDWVYSGTRRFASYPGLEPGEYVFRVKGSNNDGVWNEVGTSVAIVISPPWLKSPWAYGVYLLALLSAAYGTWKMQLRRVRVRHELEMSRFEAQKLHEVDELKTRFFANISHEFRTPLTLILGPVKQIIERTTESDTRDDLNVVHKNARRLHGLVNQLLDISKLESGNMKLRTVPQNIVPLVKALTLSFASHAERKRIALNFSAVEDDILVYIDKDKVEKIVTNILSNAFKFTPEGGEVTVAVYCHSDPASAGEESDSSKPSQIASPKKGARNDTRSGSISITVTDTGIGIPADRLDRIFDRFYQVDGSHTREQEGTGIGLSLTKELVELHKGHIEVESAEGKGTTFVVRIPLGKEHLKPEEICEQVEDEERNVLVDTAGSVVPVGMMHREDKGTAKPDLAALTETDRPLLLIVEDNADVRNYIFSNVKKVYRILEAVDGEDGWNKSVEHMPDIIVSDVMMPKMDGFMLCDKLKADERTSHIPVVLLTAKASTQDKIEGYRTGADDYIMKPFEQAELRARLQNLLEQRKRLHEHFRKHGLFEIEGEKITSVDQKFLEKALLVITERMSEPGFGVEILAQEMAVSHSLLLKKTEALTGEPPVDLIKRTRLNKAAKLIESGFGNAFQVALEVGFSSPSYFAKCFKRQFGVTPSEYHRPAAKPQT